ncbi:hypothetical protein KI387_006147, partial [Taxus chinensis]
VQVEVELLSNHIMIVNPVKSDQLSSDTEFRFPHPAKALKTFMRSRAFREFASGALSGGLTKTVVAPLETIRTRMIIGIGSKRIINSFKEVLDQRGWRGLWSGNGINILRTAPCQAIELCMFEAVKRSLISTQKHWEKNGYPQVQIAGYTMDLPLYCVSPVAIAGAVAGVVSTTFCYPLEVLKDRFTIHNGVYQSIGHALKKIVVNEGPGALYAGIVPTLIGMIPYSASYYFVYESAKQTYCRSTKKKSLNHTEALLIGSFAGLVSSTMSFPMEVARKRLMIGMLEGKYPGNMITVLRDVIQEDGLNGLYRGWGASCLK